MSQADAPQTTFASGRYLKRKRTQINYRMEELEFDDTDNDTDIETEEEDVQPKKQRRTIAKAPRSLPKRNVFPFLQLPAEIRNMIYAYALTDPAGINFVAVQRHRRRCVERVSQKTLEQCSGDGHYRPSPYQRNDINDNLGEENGLPTSLVPSLLEVNKQIHGEGSDILYGNELVFADTIALYAFIINLGPASASHLKKIRLKGWGRGRTSKAYNNACFAVLIWATSLEKFSIDTRIGWHGTPKLNAQQFYRDAFPWLEAVGAAKGKYNAAIDILEISDVDLGTYFWHRYIHGSNITSQSPSAEEKLKAFRSELSRNLLSQQKRVMGESNKRRKVSKVSDDS